MKNYKNTHIGHCAHTLESTVELGYNVVKETEYFVSL
jgi:hypothetical protein